MLRNIEVILRGGNGPKVVSVTFPKGMVMPLPGEENIAVLTLLEAKTLALDLGYATDLIGGDLERHRKVRRQNG